MDESIPVADAADIAGEQEARALERYEADRRHQLERERRIAESMRGHDPTRPMYCHDCGEQIAPDRLVAYPMAARCTACSAAYEAAARARWPR